jgi:RNA polymerase sigma factor (sigma-70 family)
MQQSAAEAAPDGTRRRVCSDDGGDDGDCGLLARIAAGDRSALERLYAYHQRRLFRYLCQLTSDRGLAEEILQDTILAVWQAAGTFQRRSSVRSWLFGIARRQAHNALRRRGRDTLGSDELEAVRDGAPGPESRAVAAEDSERLTAALGRLSVMHREVVALVLVEGFSYADVATLLEVPEGTVKSRLNHARGNLRALLAEHEPDRETQGVTQ